MEEKKNKVKEYFKKNWKGIAIPTGIAAAAVLGYKVGYERVWKQVEKSGAIILDDNIEALVRDADRVYSGGLKTLSWVSNIDPLTVNNMGELGEKFKELAGTPETDTYTHILLFGKPGDKIE